MPYVILRQNLNPDSWALRPSDEVDFMSFLTGQRIEGQSGAYRLDIDDESKEPSDFFEFPYFVVSDRMRAVLLESGIDNIDFYQAILHHPDNDRDHSGYWIGNVIGTVTCVDESKSQYKQMSGDVKLLRNFEVIDTCARGLLLFRLVESTALVLISTKIQERLIAAKLSGIYFQETNKYEGEPASSFWDE